MVRLLEYAADAGMTFFDTAASYVAGESERLLGEVFGRGWPEVVIATKVGATSSRTTILLAKTLRVLQGLNERIPWLQTSTRPFQMGEGQNFSPAYLRRSVEGSLRRLQRDRIDLLQLHNPPVAVMQRDDVFETLERLRTDGTVRFYGVAFGAYPEPVSLPTGAGLSSIQIPISIIDDGVPHEILGWAGARALGVIGNQPFKKGTLLRMPGLDEASLAQAALRAVIQVRGVSTVLAGTTSVAHLRENLSAIEGPSLTPEDVRRLRSALTAEPARE
jgi:aryl-alcohol dehydrogenase-like predicted oxidoreductase